MAKWIKVVQCNECKKIYKNGVPLICKKCGETIASENFITNLFYGDKYVVLENSKRVTAKKTLFGWKVRNDENNSAHEVM